MILENIFAIFSGFEDIFEVQFEDIFVKRSLGKFSNIYLLMSRQTILHYQLTKAQSPKNSKVVAQMSNINRVTL